MGMSESARELFGEAPAPTLRTEVRTRAPAVSVIIPAFNAAQTIDKALHSLDRQGRVAWEAIVVDDGSTDDTGEIVRRRMKREPRLRLIRQAQSGVSAARNAGVAAAYGEWLCFLDADDWLAPRAFGRLLALARHDPEASVLVGGATRVGERGEVWDWDSRDLTDPFAVLSTHCSIAIHSALVRRSAVRDLGGFDEELKSSEDWDLWQRLARAGRRFAQTRKRVAFYRARPGSLSRDLPRAAHAGLAVMRRGHAPDPRVQRPLARHRDGAPADDLPTHEFYYLLWCAARDIATGGDGLATAAPLRDGRDVDFSPSAIGGLMASGIADALACRLDRLGPYWERFEPKLAALLEFVCPDDDRRRLRRLALGVIRSRMNGKQQDEADVLRLDALRPVRLDPEADDFAVLQLRSGKTTAGAIALPLLGAREGADLVEAVARQAGRIPLKAALEAVRPWRRAAFWKAAAPAMLDPRGSGLRVALRHPQQAAGMARSRLRRALETGLEAAVRAGLAPLAEGEGPSPHARALAGLRAETAAVYGPAARRPRGAARTLRDAANTARAGDWDAFFAEGDPWNCATSDYERLKYLDTLELIPELPEGCALELACAEGHFAAALSSRVGALLATDISQRALERAAKRCEGLANIAFRALDFASQPLPGRYDLIVCSEALYYLDRPLKPLARKLAAALKPGGLLVMAHANQIGDEPEATGFDWGRAFGARTIGEAFSAEPGLALEREIRRPLYRVQAFRRLGDGRPEPAPVVEERALDVRLEPEVARDVAWGGGESRIAAFHQEVAVRIPILMYHRVAPDGDGPQALDRWRITPDAFEAQMAWLRRRGRWGVSPDELAAAMASGKPLPGRPVMITFDDGYEDLAEHAWPILQKHDFAATVFVVPAKVGGVADWDERFGAPSRLMGWDRIAELADAGLYVESHGLTHRPLSRLPVLEVYREMLASQAQIEAATGRAPISVCYPYGAADRVVESIAEECGLKLGFGVMPEIADLSDDPFRLPRIEVSGFDDLASFGRKLGLG
jgi:peptidoglycan/xylan/chitin deacetylase (PgdA/CDA1 family)/glycosyltransferase involved in cell wall biosynthesis/2-polyprenyl-3-methyl-5-hydroxy-6-metoxy-1,4-benzoquinol methylase